MTSAASATEQAVYDALDAGVTGATVYQHAPENASLPLVIIGDIDGGPMGTKGDTDRELSLTITTLTQGEQRAPLLELMEMVETALHSQRLASGGWNINPVLTGEAAILGPDGETYIGTQTFTVFALA